MGFEQLAAVDRSRSRREQLHGRYGHALPERHARDIYVLYIFIGDHLPARSAGQVHRNLLTDAEAVQTIIKGIDAHAQRKLHKHGVAGVCHGILKRFVPMRVAGSPAADLIAIHHGIALAGETLPCIGHAVFQCQRGGQDFEGGTGLVGILHAFVAHQGAELAQVIARRRIEVKIRRIDHAEDLAGLYIHHHGLHALCASLLQRLLSHFFHHGLDDVVHREPYGIAVFRHDVFFLARLHLASARVDFGYDAAVRAAQDVIQALFQAFLSFAGDRAKAQHLRKEIAHGIGAHGIFADGDALQLCRTDLIAHFQLHLSRDAHGALGGIGDLFIDFLLILTQYQRKLLRGVADAFCLFLCVLRFFAHNVAGVCGDGHRACGLCQHLAVDVHDLPAFCRNGKRPRPLRQCAVLQLGAADDLYIEKTSHHDRKTYNNNTKEPANAVLRLVGWSVIGHVFSPFASKRDPSRTSFCVFCANGCAFGLLNCPAARPCGCSPAVHNPYSGFRAHSPVPARCCSVY